MQVLILIVILSILIGLILGIDPSKGSLFSYYIFSKSKILSLFNLIYTTIFPFIISFAGLLVQSNFYVVLALLNITLIHSIFKIKFGFLLHYKGTMNPSILDLIKWGTINSLISMDYFSLLLLTTTWKEAFFISLITSLVSKCFTFIIYLVYNVSAIKILCSINYDIIFGILNIVIISNILISLFLINIFNNFF
jgi:hypothetical protein